MQDMTPFILRLVCAVYLAVGLGILLSPNYYRKAFTHMFDNKAVTYLAGLLGLVVGFAVVTYHNVWQGWATMVTLLGWVAFLKGLFVLIGPEHFMKASIKVMKNDNFKIYGMATVILGVIFGYFGFFFQF